MELKALCSSCNEFLESINKKFTLEPFLHEHYKPRYCEKDWIGFDDQKISCLTIYGHTVKYFSKFPSKLVQSLQPERSKREDSQECEMRCSEHCGNTVREVQ